MKYYYEFASKFVMGEPGVTRMSRNGTTICKTKAGRATAWCKKAQKIK